MIHGGAKGVDTIAGQWAEARGIPVDVHKPDWNRYGRGAGIIRNREMVDECDQVILFWDGISRGTQSNIRFAAEYGKPCIVYRYDERNKES